MDLIDCSKKFQAIADLCLNDSFSTLEFSLSRVSLKLSLILRKLGLFLMIVTTCSGQSP